MDNLNLTSVGLGVRVDMVPVDQTTKSKKTKNVAEMKTDLQLLLECLKCHMNDASVQKDTLLTVAAMCTSSEEAQDYFRECGGINFVLNLLTSTQDSAVKISALYTLGCACEKNVFSQKRMCTTAVFKFLYCQLVLRDEPNDRLRRTTAFLLLCLVTNNGEGQNLARTSHCLEVLLKLFKKMCPISSKTHDSPGQRWLIDPVSKPDEQMALWVAVTSALCGCVNNPQNEKNQAMCATIAFPAAITILNKTRSPSVVRLVSSFLSLTIANNVNNQDQFGIMGGMEVLVELLQSITESVLQQPNQDATQAAVQLANVFDSCITDSDQNHSRLADLNLVSLLVQLVSMEIIELDVKLKVIVTLGHLTEKCERSQHQLLESDGLNLLVHIMTENHDDEFNKAAMYLLSNCVNLVSCTEGENANNPSNKTLPTKLPGSAQKRNMARAERESRFIPIHDKKERTEAKPQGNTNAVVGSPAEGVISNRKTDIKILEDQVIDGLLEQLLEEKRTRKILQDEKEALKKRAEAQEKSKKAAEAITRELERQCQENMETQPPHREEEDSKSINSNQLPLPDVKELEQKIYSLEKRLVEISSLGNQLGGGLAQMSQIDEQPIRSHDQSTNTVVRCWKPPIDSNNNHRDTENVLMTQKQLNDSINMRIRNISSAPDDPTTSKQTNGFIAQKSAPTRSDLFKIPTMSIRICSNRASQDNQTKQSTLMLKRKRAMTKTHYEECVKHRRHDFDNESLHSVLTDSDISITASDMNLLKQAQSSSKQLHIDKRHAHEPRQGSVPFDKPRKSFRVDFSSDKGAMFSVPCSKQLPQLTTSLPTGANKGSQAKLMNTYAFHESQSDLSGVSSICSNHSSIHRLPKCPGCAPPINRPLLNSRNFLYTLERNPHTCPQHRDLHRLIKQDIQRRQRQAQTNDTSSSLKSTKSKQSHLVRNVMNSRRTKSPIPASSLEDSSSQDEERTIQITSPRRRKRQEFNEQEVKNLIEGVAKKGKHWNNILWSYHFAPGRTSVDLKDKYRRLQAQNYPGIIKRSSAKSSASGKGRRMKKTTDPTWNP